MMLDLSFYGHREFSKHPIPVKTFAQIVRDSRKNRFMSWIVLIGGSILLALILWIVALIIF